MSQWFEKSPLVFTNKQVFFSPVEYGRCEELQLLFDNTPLEHKPPGVLNMSQAYDTFQPDMRSVSVGTIDRFSEDKKSVLVHASCYHGFSGGGAFLLRGTEVKFIGIGEYSTQIAVSLMF